MVEPIQVTVSPEGNDINIPLETFKYILAKVNESKSGTGQVLNVTIKVKRADREEASTLSLELPATVVAMLLKNNKFPSDLVESMKSANREPAARNFLRPTGPSTEKLYSALIKQMADIERVEINEEDLRSVLETLVISRMAEEQLG